MRRISEEENGERIRKRPGTAGKVMALILAVVIAVTGTVSWPQAGVKQAYASDFSPESVKVQEFTSNSHMPDGDEVRLWTDGYNLSVDLTGAVEAVEYRLGFIPASYTGSNIIKEYVRPVSGWFRRVINTRSMKKGKYYLSILRARNEKQTNRKSYGDGSGWYRAALVEVDGSGVHILKHNSVIEQNMAVKNDPAHMDPECYLDTSLEDMDFCLQDYKAAYQRKLTDSQIRYIKQVSDRITAGADSDYDKARAIFRYIGENVYYDVYANKNNPDYAYLNPYRNIRAIETKTGYFNSSGKGSTGTLCTGYTSMAAALLRTQGIPARAVYGFHLNTPVLTWEEAQGVQTKSNHYWIEFYADGRWISADPYLAGGNRWNRTSPSDKGTWTRRGFTSYTYFDPSEEQLAMAYYTQGVYSKSMLTRPEDVKRVTEILNETSGGITNGQRLGVKNSTFSEDGSRLYSWDTAELYAGGKQGQLQKVNWAWSGISFDGDMSGFTGLKWLNLKGNYMDSFSIRGNTSQISLYVDSTEAEEIDARDCPALKILSAEDNLLKKVQYTWNGNRTARVTAEEGGTFSLSYSYGKHQLTAQPDSGYRFAGWYTEAGKKMSSKIEYSPTQKTSFTRVARFVKK